MGTAVIRTMPGAGTAEMEVAITPVVMGILLETMEMGTGIPAATMVMLPVIMGMATVRIRTTETAATVLPTTEKEETGKTTGM